MFDFEEGFVEELKERFIEGLVLELEDGVFDFEDMGLEIELGEGV